MCDLDGTLLGDDVALRRFSTWLSVRRDEVALVYNSGRLHWSILEAIDLYPLPQPDFVVGGVGTEIRPGLHGDPWMNWTAKFERWETGLVRRTLQGRFQLRLQPDNVQSSHKVSYFAEDLTEADLVAIQQVLEEAGLSVRLIYSSSRDLDVVPVQAGKGEASLFLAAHLDIPPDQVIACGDSGNDRCMLERAGRAVIVANAFAELHNLRGPTVYHSPQRYAAGVLDGVQHWLRLQNG